MPSSSSHPLPPSGWGPLSQAEASDWGGKLLLAEASFHQFPYWVEPYRSMGIHPVYLVYRVEGLPVAYVCVQRLGIPGIRLGFIVDGPVSLAPGTPVEDRWIADLVSWARKSGYLFLKFAHSDPHLAARMASLPGARTEDPFPHFGCQSERLLVNLDQDEEAILASFDRVGRRDIRVSALAGYEIRYSSSPEAMAEAWPLIQSLAKRKGFRVYRPLEGWQEMVSRASSHDCARVYSLWMGSELIQTVVIVRDARVAELSLAALDVEALGKRPSPGCLIHWEVMKDMRRLGCTAYNFGPPTGAVFRFKSKFNPTSQLPPDPVSFPTNRPLFAIWSLFVPRVSNRLWPLVRGILAAVLRRK